MQAARDLARMLLVLAKADLPARRRGPVLKLALLTLNRALSYDICVSPPDSLEPHAVELDALVASVVRECVDPTRADDDPTWAASLAILRRPRTRQTTRAGTTRLSAGRRRRV